MGCSDSTCSFPDHKTKYHANESHTYGRSSERCDLSTERQMYPPGQSLARSYKDLTQPKFVQFKFVNSCEFIPGRGNSLMSCKMHVKQFQGSTFVDGKQKQSSVSQQPITAKQNCAKGEPICCFCAGTSPLLMSSFFQRTCLGLHITEALHRASRFHFLLGWRLSDYLYAANMVSAKYLRECHPDTEMLPLESLWLVASGRCLREHLMQHHSLHTQWSKFGCMSPRMYSQKGHCSHGETMSRCSCKIHQVIAAKIEMGEDSEFMEFKKGLKG